jgi:hypothetical protein
MKPHPRIRKAIKWGGLALCLLLAGVWVRSEFVADTVVGTTHDIWWDRGTFWITCRPPSDVKAGYYKMISTGVDSRRWFLWVGQSGQEGACILPLWIPLAPTHLATAAAWRLDALARRRVRAGLCPKCHYDRAGLAASAVGPECGSLPAEPAPHAEPGS